MDEELAAQRGIDVDPGRGDRHRGGVVRFDRVAEDLDEPMATTGHYVNTQHVDDDSRSSDPAEGSAHARAVMSSHPFSHYSGIDIGEIEDEGKFINVVVLATTRGCLPAVVATHSSLRSSVAPRGAIASTAIPGQTDHRHLAAITS